MFVLRRSGNDLEASADRLLLKPLDADSVMTSFEWSETADPAAEAFRLVFDVRGPRRVPPRFAVFADWQVAPDGNVSGFRRSRLDLFTLRARMIEAFCVDYLFDRTDDRNQFTVLGLYGTREGLDLARDHPEIVVWAKAHPPTQWGAVDTSGVKLFRVASADGWP